LLTALVTRVKACNYQVQRLLLLEVYRERASLEGALSKVSPF